MYTSTRNKQAAAWDAARNKALFRLGALVCALVVTACGGGGKDTPTDGGSDARPASHLQGGAIQGAALALSNEVSTIAGTAGQLGTIDGPRAVALLKYPKHLTTDGHVVYFTESEVIRKMDLVSGVVTTIAGAHDTSGSADGVGTAARFSVLDGITTDGRNLYVVDSYNNTIRKMDLSTGVVSTLAGMVGSTGVADGIGTAAKFARPSGITTDGSNLFVTEPLSHTIRKVVIATGQVSTFAGAYGEQGLVDGVGTNARFYSPEGITTDGKSLYVSSNFGVRKIDIATATVSPLAGGRLDGQAVDGIGPEAGFGGSIDITCDGPRLYVTDWNRAVRMIDIATKTVTTLAGSPSETGTTDGPGVNARFDFPYGITTDGKSLFIADEYNHTIRKLN